MSATDIIFTFYIIKQGIKEMVRLTLLGQEVAEYEFNDTLKGWRDLVACSNKTMHSNVLEEEKSKERHFPGLKKVMSVPEFISLSYFLDLTFISEI